MLICICVYIYKYIINTSGVDWKIWGGQRVFRTELLRSFTEFFFSFFFHEYPKRGWFFSHLDKNLTSTSSLWDVTKTTMKERKQKKVQVFKALRHVVLSLWQIYVGEVCNQEEPSSRHNHRFLCCIDGKKKCSSWKWKRKKTKIYFCTKVILSLASVLCLFSSVGRCVRCGKA